MQSSLRGQPSDAATLADAEAQRAFERDGFAVLDIFSREEAAELRAWYQGVRPPEDGGLVIDYIREDRSMMHLVRAKAAPLLSGPVQRCFRDHRVAMTTFVTKFPDGTTSMFLHEDRTFVDERVHRAGTLWIPLVDVGPEHGNGGLQLIPGSQVLSETLSGSLTPELFRPYESVLRPRLVEVSLRAGQAILYDTRTLHASPPNCGAEPREALVCAIVPASAPLVHVVATGRRHRQMWAVDDAFYLDHHPREIEQAMPASARLLETWEEEVELDASLVASFLGVDGPIHPEVVVPDDVRALAEGAVPGAGPSLVGRGGAWGATSDLQVDQGVGGSGAPPSTQVLTQTVAPWSASVGGEGDGWVLHPGARLRFEGRPAGWRLQVIEGPLLGAGVAGGGGAVQLDPGCTAAIAADEEAVCWNLGPGPLVLAIS